MKKSAEKLGQLLNYEKLSSIPLLGLPQVDKKNVPDYIQCPRYERAKGRLDTKMERHNTKIAQIKNDIASCHEQIISMTREANMLAGRTEADRGEAMALAIRGIDTVARRAALLQLIPKTSDKHDDYIDKLKDAEEDAKESLEELTIQALQSIDEDIPMVINRIGGISENFANSDDADDLLAAIDVCTIGLRVYAMFEDLIDDNRERKEAKEGITKINQTFSNLCVKDSTKNYMVGIYRRNLDLVQQNSAIAQQIDSVLASVNQTQLDTISQSINEILSENFDTKFDYSMIIEQTELDKIIGKINDTIDSLKTNIDKAEAFKAVDALAVELGKAGVNADQQAKSLRASMQSNVDTLGDPLTQNHIVIQIINEAVINDFYQKDLRMAVSGLRKHIVDTIDEANFESVFKGGDDRFSLQKAQTAIENAKLGRLQVALDKLSPHIKDLTGKITGAETDIRKANETLKDNIQKADEIFKQRAQGLRADASLKLDVSCIPVFGMFTAIGVRGKIKEFETEFRGGNQLYKDIGNELTEKTKKMSMAALIINLLVGLGSLIVFLVSGGPAILSVIVLAMFGITYLMLFFTGKQLKDYLDIS